jgi:hypothetical protein
MKSINPNHPITYARKVRRTFKRVTKYTRKCQITQKEFECYKGHFMVCPHCYEKVEN